MLQIPAHQSCIADTGLQTLTRHTDLYTGVSGICAPVQNSEYTLNTQAFTNFASQEMVILATSLLAPWLNPASISISTAISTIAHLDVPTVTARCEFKLV